MFSRAIFGFSRCTWPKIALAPPPPPPPHIIFIPNIIQIKQQYQLSPCQYLILYIYYIHIYIYADIAMNSIDVMVNEGEWNLK